MNSLSLDFNTLQPLTLQFRCRLHCVHDRELENGDQETRADDRVRSERHEHIRELVDGDGEVRDGVRLPFLIQVNAIPPDDLEWELPGGIITYAAECKCSSGEPDMQTASHTCCAEYNVELLVLPILCLNTSLREPLDGARDEVGLQENFQHPFVL